MKFREIFRSKMRILRMSDLKMNPSKNSPGARIISLDAARQRRFYIQLAKSSEDWQEVCASFAFSGLTPDDNDAERAGRVIAGHVTTQDLLQEIMPKN